MKERPILFNGEMVRAILDGRKTQTRRVIKPQPTGWTPLQSVDPAVWGWCIAGDQDWGEMIHCPYGVPGDRLWVRETWAYWGSIERDDAVIYRADADRAGVRWRPSIHMPKKYARIWLEVVNVRAERLQEITERDAYAEGCPLDPTAPHPLVWFRDLWDSINAKRGYEWAIDPWVWAVEFYNA